jgi:hypothetical protein
LILYHMIPRICGCRRLSFVCFLTSVQSVCI